MTTDKNIQSFDFSTRLMIGHVKIMLMQEVFGRRKTWHDIGLLQKCIITRIYNHYYLFVLWQSQLKDLLTLVSFAAVIWLVN